MTQKQKPCVSNETFDDFLAEQGMLETCEAQALQEIAPPSTAKNSPQGSGEPVAPQPVFLAFP